MELEYRLGFDEPYDVKRAYFEIARTCREEDVPCPTLLFHQILPLKFEILHLGDPGYNLEGGSGFHMIAVRRNVEIPRALRLITRELMRTQPEYYNYQEGGLVRNSVPDMRKLYEKAAAFAYDEGIRCPQVVVLKQPLPGDVPFGVYFPHGDTGAASAIFLKEDTERAMEAELLKGLREAAEREAKL